MPSPSAIELARTTRSDLALLEREFTLHIETFKSYELAELRMMVGILTERVTRLEKAKDQADTDKRQWQFVYITLGVIGSLLSGLVVQLLLWALKT